MGQEIFTREVPFSNYQHDGQVMTAVVIRRERPARPRSVSDWIWEVVDGCWAHDVLERFKIETVVQKLEAVLSRH